MQWGNYCIWAQPLMRKTKIHQIFLGSVLPSEHNSNTQHCIMPVCILLSQIQRRDIASDSEKKHGISVKIFPKGKPPSLIQDPRQWGFSYPQWKDRQKEEKMVPLFLTSKTRVSDPITRLAISYVQKQSWLTGTIYWKSFLFCHVTETVRKRADYTHGASICVSPVPPSSWGASSIKTLLCFPYVAGELVQEAVSFTQLFPR